MNREERHTESYSMAGKTVPAKDETTTYWISEKAMRAEGDSQSVLVLPEKKALYLIDNVDSRTQR